MTNLSKYFESHKLGNRIQMLPKAVYDQMIQLLIRNGISEYRRQQILQNKSLNHKEVLLICDFLDCDIFSLFDAEFSLLEAYIQSQANIEEAKALSGLIKAA